MTTNNHPTHIEAARLTLYGRTRCHLCEQMLEQLHPLLLRYAVSIDFVDIDSNSELVRKYNVRIPVLKYEDEILAELILNQKEIEQHFNELFTHR